MAYAMLGLLAWLTLSNDAIRVFGLEIRLRTGTFMVLGLFALRQPLYFGGCRIEEEVRFGSAMMQEGRCNISWRVSGLAE